MNETDSGNTSAGHTTGFGQSTGARAVALHYGTEQAPVVVATGEDRLAEQILALARDHHVPIFQNPLLSDMLARLKTGEQIPEGLYRVVAELIAFVYFVRGRMAP